MKKLFNCLDCLGFGSFPGKFPGQIITCKPCEGTGVIEIEVPDGDPKAGPKNERAPSEDRSGA